MNASQAAIRAHAVGQYKGFLADLQTLEAPLLATSSHAGLVLGESLGQVGIFLIFIAVLLLRPQGLFGAKA